jgi:hypothetical protein
MNIAFFFLFIKWRERLGVRVNRIKEDFTLLRMLELKEQDFLHLLHSDKHIDYGMINHFVVGKQEELKHLKENLGSERG